MSEFHARPGHPTLPSSAADVEVRLVTTHREYAACVELQKATWGAEFNEIVPATILKIANRVGGLTAGAFQGDRLLGFVFGMTGVEGGRLMHWSHMLGVRPEARNLGLGRRLKEFQSALLRERGVEVIYWTFDPLVARNAHLNLNRLGARVREYVPEMYPDSSSTLHKFGTDRFVVAWELERGRRWRVEGSREGGGEGEGGFRAEGEGGLRAGGEGEGGSRGEGEGAGTSGDPAVTRRNGAVGFPGSRAVRVAASSRSPSARSADWERVAVVNEDGLLPEQSEAKRVRIEIPADVQSSPETAGRWRESTRGAFLYYLGHGYDIVGFEREAASGRCFYLLTAPEA